MCPIFRVFKITDYGKIQRPSTGLTSFFIELLRYIRTTGMFETFEHTADLGLRIRAAALDDLFVEAGRALNAAFVENPSEIRGTRTVEIHVDGSEVDYLLMDWLSELLFRFESHGELLTDFDVRITEHGLSATAAIDEFDSQIHRPAQEIKAITYHGLKAEKVGEEWVAEVIVDL
jgi:SHS2 domain-containing protein